MFLDVLNLIYSSLERVIEALDVPLFEVGLVSISFWELLLGMFTVTIIFGFFLRERMGSGLGTIKNVNDFENAQNNREFRYSYSRKYNSERGRDN